MAATITVYNSFRKYIGDGTIDLNSDTIKVSLHTSTYTASAAHTIFSQATNELSTAYGYTAGGATLTAPTYEYSGAVATFDGPDIYWDASGGSIVCRTAVIYKSGTTNGIVSPLIAYVTLDSSDVTTTTGNRLTIQWNGSGIFTLS